MNAWVHGNARFLKVLSTGDLEAELVSSTPDNLAFEQDPLPHHQEVEFVRDCGKSANGYACTAQRQIADHAIGSHGAIGDDELSRQQCPLPGLSPRPMAIRRL